MIGRPTGTSWSQNPFDLVIRCLPRALACTMVGKNLNRLAAGTLSALFADTHKTKHIVGLDVQSLKKVSYQRQSGEAMKFYPGVLILAGCILAFVIAPSSAFASWGSPPCTVANNDHCYAITNWEMEDPPESVKGGIAFITTDVANVPEFASGAFIDDELWVAFKSTGGGWYEAGQEAGSYINCCSLHTFWAYARNGEGLGYEEHTFKEFEASQISKYYIEDRGANSDWCLYWAEDNVLVQCVNGLFPAYADILRAGIEAASNTRPSNEGNQEVAAVFREGTWHSWKGSKTGAKGEDRTYKGATESEMCIEPNWASNAPGNAIWRIC
jgi:hypothetical protein